MVEGADRIDSFSELQLVLPAQLNLRELGSISFDNLLLNRGQTSGALHPDLPTLYFAPLHCLQNLPVPRITQRLLRAFADRIFSLLLLSIGHLLMMILDDLVISFEQVILSDHLIEVVKLMMLVEDVSK